MLEQQYKFSVDKIRTKIPFSLKKYFKYKFPKNQFLSFLYRLYLKNLLKERFPKIISIEPTNSCNANCVMCPRDKMKRKQGFMELKLYSKIIKECVANNVVEVRLNNFGEPLLHPKLVEMVEIAKQNKFRVSFFTNGSLLNKEMSKKLISAGIDEIWVSIDSCEKDRYNEVRRNLDYGILRKNMVDLMELKKKVGKPQILISSFLINLKERKKFIKTWGPYSDDILFTLYNDWCGQNKLREEQRIEKKWPCPLLWKRIWVLWNGDVTFCCRDFDGQVILGNLNKESFKKIYFGKKYRLLRKMHMDREMGKIKVCNECKSVVFY